MHVRKLAAAAGIACGAALTLAPLASADTALLDSEISAENQLFDFYALLSGDTVTHATTATGFDSVPASDFPPATTFGEVTPLETYLYGANPILAGISTGTGPYSEFNGALTQFFNAYDVAAYAAQNGGVLDTSQGDYIENNALNHALTLGSPQAAEQYLYNFALGDLKGYEAAFSPAATTTGPTDILPYEYNEIVQLNNLFELDGRLANVYGDIAPHAAVGTNVGFDTIDPSKASDAFDSLVFGAAGASGDPGSYDVLNGALTEFFNADNVGLYSLLNGGDLLPSADLFGSVPSDWATESVSGAITGFLQTGLADIAGYFLPAVTG